MTNEHVRDLSPDMVHLVGVCAAARHFAESGRYVEIMSEGRRYRLKLDGGNEVWQVAARTTRDRDAAGARDSLVDGSTGVVLVMFDGADTSFELLRIDEQ
ncbi:hypothetical protein [Amycolatopsis anabasis]|uniref:hypothetical protein n=1 Tax=Amycolatopsis anabasis TaxID=1840409 RepID=UPI00131DDAF0|nr:hypothetical protein [Amycolatopsis anabasis]